MTRRPYEFQVLPNVRASDMDQLAALTAEGWEVIGFDWADHGTHGAILLRRPVKR